VKKMASHSVLMTNKCLCSMSTQFFWNEWYHNCRCDSYIFIALEINMLYRNVYIGYGNGHMLYIQYLYTGQYDL
jgi:hypothetical protein